jgi:hypothetical protein
VDRLKKQYLEDIQAVATKESPTSEFFGEYLVESEDADAEVVIQDLLGGLNLWMKQFFPRHRPLSVTQLGVRLREEQEYGAFVEKATKGPNRKKTILRGFDFEEQKLASDLGMSHVPSELRRKNRMED